MNNATTTDQLLQMQHDEFRQLARIERQDYFLIGLCIGAFLSCLVLSLTGVVR